MRIFYSWASDAVLARNRVIVKNALDGAVEKLCSPDRHGIPGDERKIVECDGVQPGDIVSFITTNLPTCHAHVVDVTFVTPPEATYRRCPNPNTMFEAGFALSCLGEDRVVLVFNQDHGDIAELPFDINKLNVIGFKGSEKSHRSQLLTDRLVQALDPAVQDYRDLSRGLAVAIRRALDGLLPFFQDFLREHSGDEAFVAASLRLFDLASEQYPVPELLERSLHLFHRNSLAGRPPCPDGAAGKGYPQWGHIFGVHLQRLHNECRRLLHRYRRLRASRLHRRLEDMAEEAGHLERLCHRVVSDIPDMVFDTIMVEELMAFLRGMIDARRDLAPYLARRVERRGNEGPGSAAASGQRIKESEEAAREENLA